MFTGKRFFPSDKLRHTELLLYVYVRVYSDTYRTGFGRPEEPAQIDKTDTHVKGGQENSRHSQRRAEAPINPNRSIHPSPWIIIITIIAP